MPKKVKSNKSDSDKSEKSNKSNNDESSDSSEISDHDENQSVSDAFKYDEKKTKSKGSEGENSIDEIASKEYIQTVVLERVVKYIKVDDIIKKKQEEFRKELKAIKDAKSKLEEFLIDYLDKVNEEHIQLKNKCKIVKKETERKAPIKIEDINICLVDGFKKHNLYEDENEIKKVVKEFIESIEAKREVKVRKYLQREDLSTKKEEKPEKKGKQKKNIDDINIDEIIDDVKSDAKSNKASRKVEKVKN